MGVVLNDYHYGGLPGPAATRPNRADRREYEKEEEEEDCSLVCCVVIGACRCS